MAVTTASAISRAILKPVYRFGIPNSDPESFKIVKINSSKKRQMTCRRASRAMFWAIQNAKYPTLSGALPLDPTGEGLQHPLDSPAAQRFFSLLRSSCYRHHQKITGYDTDSQFHKRSYLLWLLNLLVFKVVASVSKCFQYRNWILFCEIWVYGVVFH